ncbi:nuclear transport factor 2 family protein [Leptolyngbya sp. FACHB-541]|uniref:nuclear transport factor 2 family protein n=1 Tax=Leptolyngbya sp. FACHB-541 TaxID=2692810 RepID=UPI001681FB02|nr:nuclear transport factor 2 family protein [Leptolyngbya sp. FACHB-541]MBD1997670.1 nuclear transport factor 2 family protein [Leptolyngbya sp. FACHB-541]
MTTHLHRNLILGSAAILTGLAVVIGTTTVQTSQAQQRHSTMDSSTMPTQSVQLNTFAKQYSPANTNANQLTVEDRLEIMDLPQRFNWAVDTRQYDALANLFTTDGLLDHDWGYVQSGEAIVQLIRSHEADEDYVRHHTTNHSISVAEDGTVTMMGYLVATWVGADPASGTSSPHIIAHGVQVFTVEKENGTWKIARLTLDQTAVNSANLPDQAIRSQIASTAEERAKRDGRY